MIFLSALWKAAYVLVFLKFSASDVPLLMSNGSKGNRVFAVLNIVQDMLKLALNNGNCVYVVMGIF